MYRNAQSALNCLETDDCKNHVTGRLRWMSAMGYAETDVYVCENNDFRESELPNSRRRRNVLKYHTFVDAETEK